MAGTGGVRPVGSTGSGRGCRGGGAGAGGGGGINRELNRED